MSGGYIEAHGLTDWWESTSTPEERALAHERFTPLGGSGGLATGTVSSSTPPRVFVRQLVGWFRKRVPAEASIRERIEAKAVELFSAAKNAGDTRPPKGIFEGHHYTEYVDEVKVLKREGRLEEAAALLSSLIDVVIAESAAKVWTPAPWYFDQLAIIEAKRGNYAGEADACDRYLALPNLQADRVSKLEARRAKALARSGLTS